jgi:hypothetical protein
MDWIEQWLGLNPDGGNGTIEAAIIAAVVLVGGAVVGLVSPRARARGIAALRQIARRVKPAR